MNLVVSLADGRLSLERQPVPPVPEELAPWAERGAEVEAAGRLLE